MIKNSARKTARKTARNSNQLNSLNRQTSTQAKTTLPMAVNKPLIKSNKAPNTFLPKTQQPINTNANMPTRVQLSQEALNASREQSQKILDAATKQAARGIRKGSVALAKISQDPEVQRKFAETIVKVGDAVAIVAENGGDIFAALVEKIGPAARTITFASSDLIQDSLGNVILGAVGTVPIVGDVAEAIGQEFIDTNDSFWRSFMAIFKIFPDVINIIQKGMNDTGEALRVSDDLLLSMNGLAKAVNNVSNNLENESTNNRKKIGGHKYPKNKTKKNNRKKSTKKKAL